MANEVNVYDLIAPSFWDVYDDLQAGTHIEYWEKGGRGSCKSSFISIAIIVGMLQDRLANAIVYRQVGNTLKDSVYAQMIWAIGMLGIESICKFRSSPYEIIFKPTGQRILFRGADDPKKSKSIKLTKGYFKYLWFEELAEFPSMESIRTIKQSIMRGADEAYTLYSYNPPRSAQSWVNDEGLKDVPTRLVHSTTYLDVPKSWLGQVFIAEAEALKQANPMAYRNEYMGEITGNGGSVFENVVVRDIPKEEMDTLQWFYQGIDWGWFPDPFQWVRVAYDAKKRILYIVDEYRANKLGNKATFDAVRDRLNPNESLIADSAEPKSIGDWREYGAYWIRAVMKGPGSVAYSMKWLASLSQIVIETHCRFSAKEFLSYEYERNKDGQFVNGYPDANNHAIDAVRYAMYVAWRRQGE
ncbi:MAG: PBSX family phage terminase large subunit [Ruminococcus sp.]|nr:PBSX family phage terminase large subunit [Ruminococcus sp.]